MTDISAGVRVAIDLHRMKRRILTIVAVVLVLAQLAQPDRSVPPVDLSQDMLEITAAPTPIKTLVSGACYDCHSNTTNYPWYAYITPVNFWLQHHINEGREELNFSRWDRYANSEAAAELSESIAEGEMPPKNYSFIHGHGKLTTAQREELIAWFDANLGNKAQDDAHRSSGTEDHED